jgi:uncharacterized protein DUF6247
MTAATTKIERSGPLIRAVLAEFATDECALFKAEFQQTVEQVSEKFDLAPLDAVLDRRWGIAAIRANPLSEQEHAQVTRARDGVFDGVWARDEQGNWGQL